MGLPHQASRFLGIEKKTKKEKRKKKRKKNRLGRGLSLGLIQALILFHTRQAVFWELKKRQKKKKERKKERRIDLVEAFRSASFKPLSSSTPGKPFSGN